jgi:hypothetical protein
VAWLHVLILATATAGQAPATPSNGAQAKESPSPPAAGADEKSDKTASEATEKSSTAPKTESKPAKDEAKKPSDAKKGSTAAKASTPRVLYGPRVMTRSEMQKPHSPFLDPPGSEGMAADRYGPDTTDWREVPPWRQASFFGIRTQGRFFVYVIDCSESMIEDDRFARATMEVRRSVLALQSPQQFEVIFYNEGSIPMPGGPHPRPASSPNKSQLVSWLRIIEPDGGTDPRTAIRQALMLRPEAVFLLSDGEFPPGTAETVARFNANRIPIHCVDLSGGEGGDHLRRIARDSGGKYAARAGNLQGKQ